MTYVSFGLSQEALILSNFSVSQLCFPILGGSQIFFNFHMMVHPFHVPVLFERLPTEL